APAPALARAYHVLVEIDEHLGRLLRVLAEVPRLARQLVHPPEADVAPGAGDPFLLDEPAQGAADLEHVDAAAAVVVGRGRLLDVRGEHDLLVVDLASVDPGLDHRLLGPGEILRLDVHLDPEAAAGRLHLALQPAPA